jgi:hypothetical protein
MFFFDIRPAAYEAGGFRRAAHGPIPVAGGHGGASRRFAQSLAAAARVAILLGCAATISIAVAAGDPGTPPLRATYAAALVATAFCISRMSASCAAAIACGALIIILRG